MPHHDWLAEQFEEKRTHLQTVAYRMLGSESDADDAVQEAWLRLSRTDTTEVGNLGGWLTTVVARVCLDMLRSRRSRGEESLDAEVPASHLRDDRSAGFEHEALLADSIGPALLVVLDALTPAERVAFVLHDMFAVPFDEIAEIVGRSITATRQLASRARRRVQGAEAPDTDRNRQRHIVDAFLAASRQGDFDALLAVLAPDVVLRTDHAALAMSAGRPGAPKLAPEMHGAAAVAETFRGRATGARRATLDGAAGAVWAPGGTPRAAFRFSVDGGRIVAIELVADPERIRMMEVVMLEQ